MKFFSSWWLAGGAFFWVVGSAAMLLAEWYIWVICALLYGGMWVLARERQSRYTLLLVGALFLLSMGWTKAYDHKNVSQLSDFLLLEERQAEIEGVIVGAVKIDGDLASYRLAVHRVNETVLSQSELIQVRVQLEEEAEIPSMESLHTGERVLMQGEFEQPGEATNFGAFEYKNYLYWNHIHWVFRAQGTSSLQTGGVDPSLLTKISRLNEAIRKTMAQQVERIFPEHQYGIMQSMLIGWRSDIDPFLFEQFSLLGLSHLLAISGLHVGIFTSMVLFILRLAGSTRKTMIFTTMALLPCYILLTGAAPSVIRAGLMGMIGLYAMHRGWLKNGMNVVCAVGWLMLVWNPYYLTQISFQFSFLVTIGLICGVPRFIDTFRVGPLWLRQLLAVTIVAEWASFPISIYYFHHYSLLSAPANMLIVPVYSLIVIPYSLIVLLISSLSASWGVFLAQPMHWMNDLLWDRISWLNLAEAPRMVWAQPAIWWVMGYYVLTSLAFVMISRARRQDADAIVFQPRLLPKWVSGLVILICIGWLLYGYDPARFSSAASVHVIDVGQGDAILIRTPENKHILIDGGDWFSLPKEEWRERKDPFRVGKDVLVPLLRKRGVKEIDTLIISHHDYDHMGGLLDVMRHIPIREVWFNGRWKESDYVLEFYDFIHKREIPLYAVHAGQAQRWGKQAEGMLLHPLPYDAAGRDDQDMERLPKTGWNNAQNEHSIVLWLKMYGSTFLFTGDIYMEQEREILQRLMSEDDAGSKRMLEPLDVMKIAHHGSRTSTSAEWLSYWLPRAAVVSAGRNNLFGHPHTEVIDILKYTGTQTLRTDIHGEIQFKVTKDGIQMRTKLDG